MPKKLERCVEDVSQKILGGEIPKYFTDKSGKKRKSSATAICRSALGA